MALIELRTNPSARDLKWFGLVLAAFFGFVGLLAWRSTGLLAVPRVLWSVGAALGLVYYAVPPLRRAMFIGWSYLTYPIGWVISHVLLGLFYFAVITPVGLVMRAVGYDPMARRFDREAKTYWVPHEERSDVSSYLRQN